MTSELSEYRVEFWQTSMLGLWSYAITLPNGDTLSSWCGAYISKDRAERSALKQIEADRTSYIITGDKLKESINARSR